MESFTNVTTQLYLDFIVKEEALKKLQVAQETTKYPSISTMEANTMKKSSKVNSSFKILPQESFGDFENKMRGIGSKIMIQMACDGQGIHKEG
jgi:hypothetical protein